MNEAIGTACDVCGDKIINPDRSWPRAAEVPQEPVYIDGRQIAESHLGCYRLAQGAQDARQNSILRAVR